MNALNEPAVVTLTGDAGFTLTPQAGVRNPPAAARFNLKHWLLVPLVVAVAALAGFAGYHWWQQAQLWVVTDNAYVAGHVHQVSTRVAGTVSEVLVKENQVVAAGDVLAQLDPSELQVHVAQARASLTQADAQVARETAATTKAQLDFARAEKLFQDKAGLISKQDFDSARAALDSAQASLAAARAQTQVAAANLRDAELQLSYAVITAPSAGRVGRKNIELGNRVQPGQALIALVGTDTWVTANFKETQLARIRVGALVRLEIDAVAGREFAGRVDSIAPASGAQFALLPPDNATGNFTKIVQRVPVKIVLDPASVSGFADRLVPGISAVVKVNTRG
jgi:membrane fusion protein, multidrug efflux system